MFSYKNINLNNLKTEADKSVQSTKKLFSRLKVKKPKNLDEIVHDIHSEVFEDIDCLTCANCCKTISPTIYYKDIERMAKQLKIKPSIFIDKYLETDEDNDFVFKSAPCPFLQDDNYCQVYENRPKACREYPHTDRKRFYQVLDITLKNTYVCPAVYFIAEELKKTSNKHF